MTWKKYELTATAWKTLSATIQVQTEDGPYWGPAVLAVVELGKLCKAYGTDAEGNEICTSRSTRLSVDILWSGDVLPNFAQYEVSPATGSEAHQFAGMAWPNE
jgi:hypothetical protein